MEHILQATDLVMDYSTQQATPNATHMLALNHVDFGIQAGESIAVMGPSGSGKSTLLHALAGIITPTAGNVMFRGANLARLSDADRTKLRRSAFGFVFQSGQLLPELPAIENIALPMMLGGASYQQATDTAMLWLERLGLRQLAQQRPGEDDCRLRGERTCDGDALHLAAAHFAGTLLRELAQSQSFQP